MRAIYSLKRENRQLKLEVKRLQIIIERLKYDKGI